MKLKKLISIGLSLAVTAVCLPFPVLADVSVPPYGTDTIAEKNSNIAYEVEGGKIFFDPSTGTITSAEYGITKADIPSQINGYPVTKIADYTFADCARLTEVILPEGVTSIGEYAFWECENLVKVSIPGTVNKIGFYAFGYCTGLEEIIIPDGVKIIDEDVFQDCDSLTQIRIPDSVSEIGEGAFSYCDSLERIEVGEENPTYSSLYGVLYNKDGSTLLAVPGGITDYSIPEDVKIIGSSSFSGCMGLTDITIPDGVTEIGSCAFVDCYGISEIYIPDSVESIGDQAFWDCYDLRRIDVGENNTAYKSSDGVLYNKDMSCLVAVPISFYSYEISSGEGVYTVADSVKSIGNYAFAGNETVRGVIIPDGVTSIGEGAFMDCWETESITIPDTVTDIGYNAFLNCEKLKQISIPKGVTSIPDEAFSGCTGLSEITIPDGVTSIGDQAFLSCNGLREITIPKSVTSITNNPFSACRNLKAIKVADGNTAYTSIDGVLFNKAMDVLCAVPGSFTSYVMPDSVKTIGNYALAGCNVIEVTIPEGPTSIGHNAFNGSGLREITIPDSVTSIGNMAFSGCEDLTEVTLLCNTAAFGVRVFNTCSNLEKIYCYRGSTADDYSKYTYGGIIVYIGDMPDVPPSVPEGLGDGDGDGMISSNDAAKTYILASENGYDERLDVNGDKAVTAADAEEILKKTIRSSYKLPIERKAA